MESPMCGLHRSVDFGGSACSDCTHLLSAGGVEHGNAGGGRLPLTIDKVAVAALQKHAGCRTQTGIIITVDRHDSGFLLPNGALNMTP